jgi:hypothetical protein
VALRAARSRVRAGPRCRRPACGLRLPSAVLPLQPGAGDQLRRLRPAELARLPRAEGVAGAASCRGGGLPAGDRRRHPVVAGDGGRGGVAPRVRAAHSNRSASPPSATSRRPAIDGERARGAAAPRRAQTASCSIGCSAAESCSSRTR